MHAILKRLRKERRTSDLIYQLLSDFILKNRRLIESELTGL